ncbi:hypothetical protein BKA70DRAFT_1196659 [Coprinopsis sp. MPI-PUGE-AT-0042]|nr:hypothetical protein BKA70DRAFT_1196659 [Coprinopsis sp. MPI-PUGE-AT-0042]
MSSPPTSIASSAPSLAPIVASLDDETSAGGSVQSLSLYNDLPDQTIATYIGEAPAPSIARGTTVFAEQVFSNQDLVDMIVNHLATGLPKWNVPTCEQKEGVKKKKISKKQPPKLSKLLMLSRIFFEATSSHLWREMSSILPLFNLLPQSERGEYVLMRALKREDLTRWKVYAHHVRVIVLSPKEFRPCPSVQAFAMFLAYQAATGDVLFPALRHLHFQNKFTAEELICLTALTPPSLEGLHLQPISSSEVALVTAVQHAAGYIPQLRCLTLMATVHLESLWSILHSLTVLRTINLTIPYGAEHVESFCSLPTLQEGTLDLTPSPPSNTGHEELEASNFLCTVKSSSNGREIYLSGEPHSLVSAIPAAVRHGVTKLQVGSAESRQVAGASWDELLDVISVSCSNVSSLSLQDNSANYSIPLGALWKLMALDNLQSLILWVDCNVQPTQDGPDQIFHHLCLSAKHKAMPLTTLHIHNLSGEHLGLASLRHVSEHLPRLLDLKLSLDSSLHYEAPDGLFVGTPLPRLTQRHPMKSLRLKDLRSEPFKTKEYRTIALLINYLFPDLGTLEATGPSDGWELIGDMRRDYQYLGNAIVQGVVD